jgi:hypothetical protein
MLQSVLSAVPLYMLSIHKLPVWVRKKLDSIRAKFLWRGAYSKFEYPLVRWSKIYQGKSNSGWGIMKLDKMNKAFLDKWC